MRPIRTPQSNVTLTMPGVDDGSRDLPAERVAVYDADRGETETDATPAFETWWGPTPAERERITNGAPIVIRISGHQHPPISVETAPLPQDAPQLALSRDHADRALGRLYADLCDVDDRGNTVLRIRAGDRTLDVTPEGIIRKWERALAETRLPDDDPDNGIPDVDAEVEDPPAAADAGGDNGHGTLDA